MIERVKEKSRGSNVIGPWISLSVWAKPSAQVQQAGGRSWKEISTADAIASPRDIADAQARLFEEAQQRLGPNYDCFLFSIGMGVIADGTWRVLQINARYQGFAFEGALRPMPLQNLQLIAPGKTRAIELE